jgi:hypothetical protein
MTREAQRAALQWAAVEHCAKLLRDLVAYALAGENKGPKL